MLLVENSPVRPVHGPALPENFRRIFLPMKFLKTPENFFFFFFGRKTISLVEKKKSPVRRKKFLRWKKKITRVCDFLLTQKRIRILKKVEMSLSFGRDFFLWTLSNVKKKNYAYKFFRYVFDQKKKMKSQNSISNQKRRILVRTTSCGRVHNLLVKKFQLKNRPAKK